MRQGREAMQEKHLREIEAMEKKHLCEVEALEKNHLLEVEAAQNMHFNVVPQSIIEESKTDQRAIKSTRLSKQVVKTKSSLFGGPKTF